MGFRGITPIHPTVKHSISTNQRGRTPPTGPDCVRCTPVSDSKILFYSADCRIFLMASEDGLGNCSAKVLLVTVIPILTPHQENLFLLFPVCFLPLLRHMVVIVGLWVHAATMLRDPCFAPKLTTVVGTWQETCTTCLSLSRLSVARRAHRSRLSMSSILSIHSNAQSP